MSQDKQSLMTEKGWHYDVTDDQIEAAQRALKALIGILTPVYYTEDPDPFGGKRYFWTSVGWEEPEELGCFDHYGNLVIYATMLLRGV